MDIALRLIGPGSAREADHAMAAIVASERGVGFACCKLQCLRQVGQSAARIDLRIEGILIGAEVKGHDLEEPKGAGIGLHRRVAARFDLHDHRDQLRRQSVCS